MSITKLADGRYQWRHRVNGVHKKKIFGKRADAVAHDARVRSEVAKGTYLDSADAKITVSQYAHGWASARVVRPGTRAAIDSWLARHIDATRLGSRPISSVRPSEVQAWAADRAGQLSPGTTRAVVSRLRSVFQAAVADGLRVTNPVAGVRLAAAEKPAFVPLTVPEVQAWADHADPRVRAAIIVQASLGLRVSELRALRREDIDLKRHQVRIERQLDPRGRAVPLKTARSRRVVPLPAVAGRAIAEHLLAYGTGPGGEVFTRKGGKVWDSKGLHRAYHAAAVAADLPDGTSSHDLRHAFASLLLASGVDVFTVAERLGDTPKMILNVYGHVMPDAQDSTRAAVDAAWADGAAAYAQAIPPG